MVADDFRVVGSDSNNWGVVRAAFAVEDEMNNFKKEKGSCSMIESGLCNLYEDKKTYDKYCVVGNTRNCPATGEFQ